MTVRAVSLPALFGASCHVMCEMLRSCALLPCDYRQLLIDQRGGMQALARLLPCRGTAPGSYERTPPNKIGAANSRARPSISSPPLRIQDPHIWRRVNCRNPPKSRRKPQPEAVHRGILQLFCRMIVVILQNDSAGSAARAALSAVFVGHPREGPGSGAHPRQPRGGVASERLVDAQLHQPPHSRAVGIPKAGFEGRRIAIQHIVDV
jgi:hypothetical protein